MTIQEQILDRVVNRVKQNRDFDAARFVHANNMTPVQQPVTKLTVCCSVERSVVNDVFMWGDSRMRPVFMCEASLSFMIYAPKHTDGRTLTDFAQRLSNEVTRSDVEGVIRAAIITRPYYDRDVTALRCELTVKVSFVYGEAVSV